MRRAISIAVGTLLTIASAPAGADTPIVVEQFSGKRAAMMRKQIVSSLQAAGEELRPMRELEAIATDVPTEELDREEVRSIALELGVRAFIAGRVTRHGGDWTLRLDVRDAATGDVIGSVTWRHRRPAVVTKRARAQGASRLAPLLRRTSVPEPSRPRARPKSAGVTRAPPEGRAEVDSSFEVHRTAVPAERRRLPIVEAAIGTQLLRRSFRYRDDLLDELHTHELPGRPLLVIEATAAPFAGGVLAGLQARGRVAYGGRFDTRTAEDDTFSGTTHAWQGGLGYHVPLGGSLVSVRAHYGRHRVSLEDKGDMQVPFPDVDYRFADVGAGASVPLPWRLAFLAEAGYRHVLGAGEIQSGAFFPRASVRGVSGRSGLELEASDSWVVRATVDLARYGYALRPEPGDPWIAGGAVDQYVSATLQVGMRLR